MTPLELELASHPPGTSGDRSQRHATIDAAIRNKRQLRARHDGHPVCLCPHVLGWRGNQAYVLGFMIQPDLRLPAAPGAQGQWLRLWQWLRVDELDHLQVVEGPWFSWRGRRPPVEFLERVDRQVG